LNGFFEVIWLLAFGHWVLAKIIQAKAKRPKSQRPIANNLQLATQFTLNFAKRICIFDKTITMQKLILFRILSLTTSIYFSQDSDAIVRI